MLKIYNMLCYDVMQVMEEPLIQLSLVLDSPDNLSPQTLSFSLTVRKFQVFLHGMYTVSRSPWWVLRLFCVLSAKVYLPYIFPLNVVIQLVWRMEWQVISPVRVNKLMCYFCRNEASKREYETCDKLVMTGSRKCWLYSCTVHLIFHRWMPESCHLHTD